MQTLGWMDNDAFCAQSKCGARGWAKIGSDEKCIAGLSLDAGRLLRWF